MTAKSSFAARLFYNIFFLLLYAYERKRTKRLKPTKLKQEFPHILPSNISDLVIPMLNV